MPAAAVYCRDPDGHLLEYLAMLDAPPDPEAGVVPWSEWKARSGSRNPVRIEHHTGPRDELRPLFAMAEDSAAQLDSYLDAGELLVAVVDGRVVGHLQLVDDEKSEIKNMAVAPSYRGRGIGRRLVGAAVELMRARYRSTLAVATAAADVPGPRPA